MHPAAKDVTSQLTTETKPAIIFAAAMKEFFNCRGRNSEAHNSRVYPNRLLSQHNHVPSSVVVAAH